MGTGKIQRPARRRADLARVVAHPTVLGLLALWLRFAEGDPVTAWLVWPPPLLLAVPGIFLLCGALYRRRWGSAAIHAAAVVFVVFALAGLRVGRGRRSAAGAPLRVMSFNVEKWSHGASRVAEAIRAQHPDVVCLQEAGAYFWLKEADQQPAALAAALPGYRMIRRDEVAILTRLPVRALQTIALPPGPKERPALVATVLVGAKPVEIVAVHLLPDESPAHLATKHRERVQQATCLRQRLPLGPLVLAGDFNSQRISPVMRLLAPVGEDAFERTGSGFGATIPVEFPLRDIDHVLVRGLTVVACRIPDIQASDHRPTVADLVVP